MNQLSVVIPTFNERDNISILVNQLQAVFCEHAIDGDILIIDDNSQDGSQVVMERLAATHQNFRYRIRQPPSSLSLSWCEGFDAARYPLVVCMDADLCHDPQDLPRMLEKIADCDMVIGSRYLASGVKLMQDKSRLAAGLSVISQSLSRLALGYSGTDMSHSFRMFHKSVFNAVKVDLRHEGNTFMVEFYFETARRGFRIAEIPIIYGKRVHGKTKLDIRKEGLRYLRLLGYILLKRIRTRT